MVTKDSFNPIVGLEFLFLGITSGWTLKNISEHAFFSKGVLIMLLGYSVIGCFRFTHPNAGNILKKSFSMVAVSVQATQLPMITADILKILYGKIGTWLGLLIFSFVFGISLSKLGQSNRYFKFNLICNVAVIVYQALFLKECYWTIGFVALIILNNFVLNHLVKYYDIPQLEFEAINYCFYAIFLYNVVNEIVGVNSKSRNLR